MRILLLVTVTFVWASAFASQAPRGQQTCPVLSGTYKTNSEVAVDPTGYEIIVISQQGCSSATISWQKFNKRDQPTSVAASVVYFTDGRSRADRDGSRTSKYSEGKYLVSEYDLDYTVLSIWGSKTTYHLNSARDLIIKDATRTTHGDQNHLPYIAKRISD